MVVGESALKDVYRRLVWGPWREFLESCPPGWDYRVNRRVGRLAGRLARAKREEVVAALARAFPDRAEGGQATLHAIAVEAFGSHFANQYASFAFGRLSAENVEAWLRLEGLEHLERAAVDGVGVVLLHPHMGPAQLPLAALGAMGWKVHQIGGGKVEGKLSSAGEWASAERARLEQRMKVTLHDGSAYLRTLVRVLSRGEIVLTACDGTGGGRELGRRLWRPVLGQTMGVPVGAFWLAFHSGARIHTLHTVRDREAPERHRSVIGPEVGFPRDKGVDAALEAGADFSAAWLSLLLQRHPGDWLFWDAFRPGMLLRPEP